MSDFQPYDPNEDNKDRRRPASSAAPFQPLNDSSASSSADDQPRDYQPFTPNNFSNQQNDDHFDFNSPEENQSSDSFQPFNQASAGSPFEQSASDFQSDQPAPTYFQRSEPDRDGFQQNPSNGFDQSNQSRPADTTGYSRFDEGAGNDFGRPTNSYNPNNYNTDQSSRPQRTTVSQRTNPIPRGAASRLKRNSVVALVIAALLVLLAIPVLGSVFGHNGRQSSSVAAPSVASSSTSSSSSSSQSSSSNASSVSSSSTASSSSSTADDTSSSSSSAAAAASYTVRAGDTPYSIARANNITVTELYQLNGLAAGATLQPGQVLRVNGN